MTDTALIGHVDAPALHVMSFNVRRRIRHLRLGSPDLWSHRMPAVRRMLQLEQPAMLGVQEALPDQADFVHDSLGPDYRSIGYGRSADRGGEQCPILFDSRRLELLDWTQRALSATPEVAGSSTWGNWIPRIAVVANFRDRITAAEFTLVNTHFDHLSRRSRLHSARAIRKIVDTAKRPVVMVGDFNTDVGSPPYRELVGDSLRDSWMAADERVTEPWGTFPNYRRPRVGGRRIDWILTSPVIQVLSAGIDARTWGGVWPSDHAPVHAVVRMSAIRSSAADPLKLLA